MDEPVSIQNLLENHPGIIAVIGGGGKSTFLLTGALALAQASKRVVMTTTTHMRAVQDVSFVEDKGSATETLHRTVAVLDNAQRANVPAAVCTGAIEERTGKLIAPSCSIEELASICDHVLVEADGSRNLPFKAHNACEPVIPASADLVVYMVGASGFGRPVNAVVHRPELFCERVGYAPDSPATPTLVARGIMAEGLLETGRAHDCPGIVIVNQAEDRERLVQARKMAAVLPYPVFAGSVRENRLVRVG